MTPKETLFFNPLPDKESVEWEIRDVFEDGDIKDIGGLLQIGRTSLSKMLNPGEVDRHNPFWLVLGILWSLDLKGSGQSEKLLRIIGKHRAMWQPRINLKPEPAKTTSEIGTLAWELLEKELSGADESTRLDVVLQLEEKLRRKSDEIMAMRGLRVSVDGVGDVS